MYLYLFLYLFLFLFSFFCFHLLPFAQKQENFEKIPRGKFRQKAEIFDSFQKIRLKRHMAYAIL